MRQLKILKSITSRESDSLDKYLQDIGHEPLVSPEEEVELAQRIRKGDVLALERLCRGNLRFVVSVSKQYQHLGLPLGDLINEGNLGLIKAARKFDETRGFRFISYAVWWIRQSILQALAEHSRMVRLPLNQLGVASKIQRAILQLEQEQMTMPTVGEIAAQVGIPEDKVEDSLRTMFSHHVSMDEPLADADNTVLADLMTSEEVTTDGQLDRESLQIEVERALARLEQREREVVEALFGIGQREKTLEEIAFNKGLTRERVRQIKEKALRHLRQAGEWQALRSYLG